MKIFIKFFVWAIIMKIYDLKNIESDVLNKLVEHNIFDLTQYMQGAKLKGKATVLSNLIAAPLSDISLVLYENVEPESCSKYSRNIKKRFFEDITSYLLGNINKFDEEECKEAFSGAFFNSLMLYRN